MKFNCLRRWREPRFSIRKLFNAAFVIREDGKFVEANSHLVSLLKYPSEKMLMERNYFLEILKGEDIEELKRETISEGISERTVMLKNINGQIIPAIQYLIPLSIKKTNVVFYGFLFPVERDLLRMIIAHPDVKVIYEAVNPLLSLTELKDFFSTLARIVFSFLYCDRISIIERRKEEGKTVVISVEGVNAEAICEKESKEEGSLAGFVFRMGKPLEIVDGTPEAEEFSKFLLKSDIKSTFIVPIYFRNEPYLAVCINRLQPLRFTSYEKEFLTFLCYQAGIVYQRLRFYEELKRWNSAIFQVFCRALSIKDKYTKEHSEITSQLAGEIAKELNLDPITQKNLMYGAMLHDLGKLIIESSILGKKGPLNENEWEVMRHHPIVGAELVEDIPEMEMIRRIILQHHERLNGTGYPYGLTAENIPLESRIMAVVDVFHATTSDRPYRKAKSVEQAIEEMKRDEGLDQNVVNALIRVLKRKGILK
jgi:putative nucleotidyltransferase with HDIG domain